MLRVALAISIAAALVIGGLVGEWVERVQARVLPPLASHVRLVPLPTGPRPRLSSDDLERLAALPYVVSVQQAVTLDDTVHALGGAVHRAVAVTIRATTDTWPRMAGARVVSGRMWGPAEELSPVALISGPWPIPPTQIVWQGRMIRIIGRLVGASSADEIVAQVWMPLGAAVGSRGHPSYYLEVVDEAGADTRVADAATAMLVARYGRLRNGEPPAIAITFGAQREAIALARRILYLTLLACCAIPFVLLGSGVAAALRVSVSRRVPEIGLRRAVGATRQDIVNLVVGDAMRLAWGATWRGVLMASCAAGLARLGGMSFSIPPALVILVIALPWIVCFASAVTPAVDAAELPPIIALERA